MKVIEISSIKEVQSREKTISHLANLVDGYVQNYLPGADFMLILASKSDSKKAAYCSNIVDIDAVLKLLANAIENIESGNFIPIGSLGPVQ